MRTEHFRVTFLPHGNVSRNEVESGTGSHLDRRRRVLVVAHENFDVVSVALTPAQATRLARQLVRAVERCR